MLLEHGSVSRVWLNVKMLTLDPPAVTQTVKVFWGTSSFSEVWEAFLRLGLQSLIQLCMLKTLRSTVEQRGQVGWFCYELRMIKQRSQTQSRLLRTSQCAGLWEWRSDRWLSEHRFVFVLAFGRFFFICCTLLLLYLFGIFVCVFECTTSFRTDVNC